MDQGFLPRETLEERLYLMRGVHRTSNVSNICATFLKIAKFGAS